METIKELMILSKKLSKLHDLFKFDVVYVNEKKRLYVEPEKYVDMDAVSDEVDKILNDWNSAGDLVVIPREVVIGKPTIIFPPKQEKHAL